MSELSMFDKIQQGANDTEARNSLRDEEDQALFRHEADGLNRLDVFFEKRKNHLQAELSAQRRTAHIKADKARKIMESSHAREVKALEANHKKKIESLESTKQSELNHINQIGQRRQEAHNRAQARMKLLHRDKFILERKSMAQNRQAEDEKTTQELYQILGGDSSVCFSFSLPTPKQMVNSLPLAHITSSATLQTKSAQAGSAMSTGQLDIQLDAESPISSARPNKRRKMSPENLGEIQPSNLPQLEYPKTTVRAEVSYVKPVPEALIPSPQNEPAEQSNFSIQIANMTCGQQSMSTVVAAARPFDLPVRPRIQGLMDIDSKIPPQVATRIDTTAEMASSVEQTPVALNPYPIRFMSTSIPEVNAPTCGKISNAKNFWLYYHEETSSFKPDMRSTIPEFVIRLQTVDMIEYNAEKSLAKVHRSASMPIEDVEDGEIVETASRYHFGPLKIEFGGKDVTVAFVTLCKEKFPHVILKKSRDHVMQTF